MRYILVLVVLAGLLWVFQDDLFNDSKYRVGDAVRIIAEDRIGIIQEVKHVPITWKSKETVPSYLVWYVEDGQLQMGGKWCANEELSARRRCLGRSR